MRLTADASQQQLLALCFFLFLLIPSERVCAENLLPVTITPLTENAERNWKQAFSADGMYITYENLFLDRATLHLVDRGRQSLTSEIGSYIHGGGVSAEYSDVFSWHTSESWFAGAVAERGNYNLFLYRLVPRLITWRGSTFRIRREVLAGTTGWQGDARFFRDGRRVVFVTSERGNGDIAVCDVPRCSPVFLTDSSALDYAPDVSPAGMVVYSSRRDGTDNLYLVNPETGRERPLTTGEESYAYGVFVDEDHVVAYRNTSLVEISIATGVTSILAENVYLEQRPAVTTDGNRIAFIENRPDAKLLRIVNRRTGEVSLLDTGMYYHERPVWSPDGSAILVQGYNGLQWNLFLVTELGNASREAGR